MGHLAQNRHFFNVIIAEVELLQLGELQADVTDVIIVGCDDLEFQQVVQRIDIVKVVLGDVDLHQVRQRRHFLQVSQVLQLQRVEKKNVRILSQRILDNVLYVASCTTTLTCTLFVASRVDLLLVVDSQGVVARGAHLLVVAEQVVYGSYSVLAHL